LEVLAERVHRLFGHCYRLVAVQNVLLTGHDGFTEGAAGAGDAGLVRRGAVWHNPRLVCLQAAGHLVHYVKWLVDGAHVLVLTNHLGKLRVGEHGHDLENDREGCNFSVWAFG
jgi:hypothetical protein